MPLIEKPSGTQMMINDRPETLAHARAMGWKFVGENADGGQSAASEPAQEPEPPQEPGADVDALKAEYEAVVGKKPHHNLKPETMSEHIAEARAATETA